MSNRLTVAQALRRIKKLKGQIAEHQQRAAHGVTYDASKVPAFRYKESVEAMFALQDEIVVLEAGVAVANASELIQDGKETISMARAIRTLQELKGRIAFLKGLQLRNETVKDRQVEWDDAEMKQVTRVTETVYVSDLSEQERDTQVKALQDRFETLNNIVENSNHTILV